jgi:hypothetical protein
VRTIRIHTTLHESLCPARRNNLLFAEAREAREACGCASSPRWPERVVGRRRHTFGTIGERSLRDVFPSFLGIDLEFGVQDFGLAAGEGFELGDWVLCSTISMYLHHRHSLISSATWDTGNFKGMSDHTHSSWFGTPSAAGKSPSSSRSDPQKLGLLIGAGVTGRLGLSTSVGKSVIMLDRRFAFCATPAP